MIHKEALEPHVGNICINIVNQLEQPAIVYNENGYIVLNNQASSNFFRYEENELLGLHISNLFPYEVYNNDIKGLVEQPPNSLYHRSLTMNTRGLRKDGTQVTFSYRLGGSHNDDQLFFLKTLNTSNEDVNQGTATEIYRIVEEHDKSNMRFAEQIRDEIGTLLASAKANMEACQNEYTPMNVYFQKAVEMLEKSIAHARSVGNQLSPGYIYINLTKTLERLFEQIEQTYNVRIHFSHFGLYNNLSAQFEQDLVRMVDDLLTVWIKNTHAASYIVQLIGHPHRIVVKIESGTSVSNPFAINARSAEATMKKVEARLLMNNGQIHLDTSRSHATEVMMEFPFAGEE